MSCGRSFAPVDAAERSPEERLALLEQRLPVLIERIQKYDEMMDYASAMKNSLSDINRTALDNSQKHSEFAAFFDQFRKESDYRHSSLSKDLQSSSSFVSSIDAKVSEIKLSLDKFDEMLFSELEKNSQAIEKRFDVVASIEDLLKHKQESSLANSQLDSSLSILSKRHDRFDVELSAIRNKNLEHAESIASIEERVCSVESQLSKLYDDVSMRNLSLRDFVSSSIKQLSADFDKKLASLRSELADSPRSTDAVRTELLAKLDIVALDGSNAVLKASNGSSKISLMEKKIENLYLLVNQLQLK